jgi:hypothetical protein
MTILTRWKASVAAAIAVGAALTLSACIVSPGTFASTLDLRRDGTFTFSYNGQIYLLALSKLAEMANGADRSDDEFVESPCYDDEDFEERPCTDEEIAEQREAWESQAAARKESAEREAEQMRAFLGGIDPADPEAAEELAARLRRQEGWKRVDYRGDGLFEVEFSLSSRMGHDFTFPTLERFPMMNGFVVANLRQGNTVRIEAPGFSAQGGGNPFQGMATGMSAVFAAVAASGEGAETPQAIPEMDGTFRIVTDGRILANNTEAGAVGSPDQVLEWRVNKRTQSPPMALIQLGS